MTFIHYQHLLDGEVHQYWSAYLTSCNCISLRVDASEFDRTDFNPNGTWAGPWLTEYAGEVTEDGSDVPGSPTGKVNFANMQSQSSTTTWESQQCGMVTVQGGAGVGSHGSPSNSRRRATSGLMPCLRAVEM